MRWEEDHGEKATGYTIYSKVRDGDVRPYSIRSKENQLKADDNVTKIFENIRALEIKTTIVPPPEVKRLWDKFLETNQIMSSYILHTSLSFDGGTNFLIYALD